MPCHDSSLGLLFNTNAEATWTLKELPISATKHHWRIFLPSPDSCLPFQLESKDESSGCSCGRRSIFRSIRKSWENAMCKNLQSCTQENIWWNYLRFQCNAVIGLHIFVCVSQVGCNTKTDTDPGFWSNQTRRKALISVEAAWFQVPYVSSAAQAVQG